MAKAFPVSAPTILNFPSPGVEEPRVLFPETVKSPVMSVLSLRERLPLLSEIASVTERAPPTVVSFVEMRVVNAPDDLVVAPIAVPLIPVDVVLKLAEVKVKSFAPVLMEEAPKPESESAPDVAVRFKAPVVSVNPLDAVSSPADVIDPVPVVTILPGVINVPVSLIVRVSTPPDWIANKVFVAAFMSLITTAVAVPWLVIVKFASVAVSDRTKEMFLASVVVMVLPSS